MSRSDGAGETFAFLTLMCGIASWVPIIVVITGPLTFGFFGLAMVSARRRGQRGRVHAAWTGLLLTCLSLAFQVGLAGIAALPGIAAAGCAAS